MDYSIRPVDQKTPHSIAPRRKRDEERAPFVFTEEERRPGAHHDPVPPVSQPPSPEERAIAPRGEDEIGAHLDLSA